MREIILQAFKLLPQSSIYTCSRLIKAMKPTEELYTYVKQLVMEGLLIEHVRYHYLSPVYELSNQAKTLLLEELTLTPYQNEVVEKTKFAELVFATNQQKAYNLIHRFDKKNIYISSLMIQDFLKIPYVDTVCVLAELFKLNLIEPIGLLWRIMYKERNTIPKLSE